MASITCVVTVLIAAYLPSLLAAPNQDFRTLSDGLIERLDGQLDVNTTSSPEELSFRRLQPHELQLRNYNPPQNNNNNVRRRHRNGKLLNRVGRLSTRRSGTSDPPRGGTRTNKDSEVAIILAKLNPGAVGEPSAVRPYRLQAGVRQLTPLHDQSHETLSDILHALNIQVSGRDNANDLNRRLLVNAPPKDSPELEGQLTPPLVQSNLNDSAEDELNVPPFMSLEHIAEAYTEPTLESVIQDNADALKAETASTAFNDYDTYYEAKNTFDLGNEEIMPLKDDAKSSAENKVALGYEPIAIDPADTNTIDPADTNTRYEDEPLIAHMVDPKPTHYSQTDDVPSEPCLTDDAPIDDDTPCVACGEGDSQCSAWKQAYSQYEGHDKQADKDDVTTSPPRTCSALPTLVETESAQLLASRRDDTEEAVIKDDDVGLSVYRKSYKISIIFQ